MKQACLDWFSELGYSVLQGPYISPDGAAPERGSYGEVILIDRLKTVFRTINPHLKDTCNDACDYALRKLQQTDSPNPTEENRRLHRLMIDGVDVMREDGTIGGDIALLIDFDNPANNNWLAVNQFTVIESGHNRRPDVVVFINGLPIVVIELKSPSNEKRHHQRCLSSATNLLRMKFPACSAPMDCWLYRMGYWRGLAH